MRSTKNLAKLTILLGGLGLLNCFAPEYSCNLKDCITREVMEIPDIDGDKKDDLVVIEKIKDPESYKVAKNSVWYRVTIRFSKDGTSYTDYYDKRPNKVILRHNNKCNWDVIEFK